MARHSHRITNIHNVNYIIRNMEPSLNPSDYVINEWYDGSWEEFIRETNVTFENDIKEIKSYYKFS